MNDVLIAPQQTLCLMTVSLLSETMSTVENVFYRHVTAALLKLYSTYSLFVTVTSVSHPTLVNQKSWMICSLFLCFIRIRTSWSEPALCEFSPASESPSSSPLWCWPSKRPPPICLRMSGRRQPTPFLNSTGDLSCTQDDFTAWLSRISCLHSVTTKW